LVVFLAFTFDINGVEREGEKERRREREKERRREGEKDRRREIYKGREKEKKIERVSVRR